MKTQKTDVIVLGAGPGGSAAAMYAAEKGKKVLLIDRDPHLGGVCLNCGCIPSKALLHAVKVYRDVEEAAAHGIAFEKGPLDLAKLRAWKESVLDRLRKGLAQQASQKGVQVVKGRGYFEESRILRVETETGQQFFEFEKAVIAVGSKPALPKAFDLGNARIMTSTEALELEEVPQDLLIVGGGYIGLELGTVYAALGSRIALVEAMDALLPGVDSDLVRPVERYAKERFKSVRLGAKVLKMATQKKQIEVTFEGKGGETRELYDRVLVAVGRVPNCRDLGLENTKVKLDDKGFITTNARTETADPAIHAIGDCAGGALLAHKAAREARVSAEVIAGERSSFENVVIPAVVFTDPEIAWCGLTENEAKAKGVPVKTVRFPWSASGRAVTLDRTDGVTKLVVHAETERVLGVGITGAGAGELISEGVLAVEMGATAADLALSVHPHPTLSETLMECADLFYRRRQGASHGAPASGILS
jgi:dihydrolipoamide dehydrogenase